MAKVVTQGRNLMEMAGFRMDVRGAPSRFRGRARRTLALVPRSTDAAAVVVALLLAAAMGPAAALALADAGTGGTGIAGGTSGSGTVTVTTPCSGSISTTLTTLGLATTTTVATTETVTTTGTNVETTTDTTVSPPTTTTTTTTTPVTTTVPTTETLTTPGTTTVRLTPACTTAAPPPSTISVPTTNPFRGRAMWIWELSQSNGGNVAAIIARAKRYGLGAVYIKSSDGSGFWSQFSSRLVTALHEAGLKVCAWQYVYGASPVAEANVGARAVRDGADCLVIDAESQYQGRYAAADTYITRLRQLIGNRFPVGLAGFPYVDYHLSFPYSVFLGPGGAQYNLPQMYWSDIGTTVSMVYAHTYEYNEIYRRPIFPLGQLWGRLSASSIEQFNTLAKAYGATGVSWWDWQSSPLSYWTDMTRNAPLLVSYIQRTPGSTYRGNRGDLVIWAQEHLYAAGYKLAIDGAFGAQTQRAVRAFQTKHRIQASGIITGATWDALDRYTPVSVRWTQKKGVTKAVIARGGKVAGHSRSGTLVEQVPAWTHEIRSRNELHGHPGEGRPSSARR